MGVRTENPGNGQMVERFRRKGSVNMHFFHKAAARQAVPRRHDARPSCGPASKNKTAMRVATPFVT